MKVGMYQIDNFDWTVISSLLAFSISVVATEVDFFSSKMAIVYFISASVLCITGIIKLLDLILEKIPTWIDKSITLKNKIKSLIKPKE
jgi:predicted benzoate:H+ symporter BenE